MRGKNKFKYTYNNYEFSNAVKVMKDDPYLSLELYKEYLEKYPTDYAIYSFVASNLILFRRFEEAKKIIEKADILCNNDKKYCSNKERYQTYYEYMTFSKLQYLIYTENYSRAYDYCLENYNIVCKNTDSINSRLTLTYLNSKLQNNLETKEEGRYLYNQMVDYQKTRFLDHIKKHLADYAYLEDNPNKFVFLPDFPVDKVLEEVYSVIPSDAGLCTGLFSNKYYFKYDECGKVNNRLTNYFGITTFHNTNEIITMCPIELSDNYEVIDMNYLKPQKEMVRVKRLSQIEKFNNKYNLK